MATRIYKFNPGDKNVNGTITEGIGSAVATKGIEVTIDLSTAYKFNSAGAAVAMSKEDILLALHEIIDYISGRQWPPA